MRSFTLFLLISITSTSLAQSKLSAFFRISGPEKTWTLLHPFKAGRAWKITRETRELVKTYQQLSALDTFHHGGKIDAFRHTYWMARVCQTIGPKGAFTLGKAHERGNYRQFRKGKGEDGTLQDSTACVMDLRNNDAGIALGHKHRTAAADSIATMVIDLLNAGNLTIMKRNAEGQLVTCEGRIVTLPVGRKRAWALPYCLLRSDGTP